MRDWWSRFRLLFNLPAFFGILPDVGSMMSVSLFPFCRICHMAASDSEEPLISPCRCSGTMQYIHGSCLMVCYLRVCVCVCVVFVCSLRVSVTPFQYA